MNGQMLFPEKWEDFVIENIITDHKQIYTNGLDLMTMDDVGTMMTHYLKIEQEKHQWIPCNERLPEKNGWYLVTYKYETDYGICLNIYIARSNGEDGLWCGNYGEKIISWMPLPEPYKESDD